MVESRLGPGEAFRWLLYACPFVALFDRYAIAPLLVPIAVELRVPLSAAALAASLYLLVGGALQLPYGMLSDHLGRVRVLRWALLGMAVVGVVSASAANLPTLLVGRTLTGAMVGAVLPTSLVYVGDVVPFAQRQRSISDVVAAIALGTVSATIAGALLAQFLSWRLAFLAPAVGAMFLASALRWMPEPSRRVGTGNPLAGLRHVLTRGWPLFLMAVGLVEGAAIFGFLQFLAPAVQGRGGSAIPGMVVCGYGAALLCATRLMKWVGHRAPGPILILAGGTMLVLGFSLAAAAQTVPVVMTASALGGVAYGVMHSTLQTWVTEVAPAHRGTAMALFSSAILLGAGLATSAASGLADDHRWGMLFAVAGGVTAPMVIAATGARCRFVRALGHAQEATS